jgi:hypothetical protein
VDFFRHHRRRLNFSSPKSSYTMPRISKPANSATTAVPLPPLPSPSVQQQQQQQQPSTPGLLGTIAKMLSPSKNLPTNTAAAPTPTTPSKPNAEDAADDALSPAGECKDEVALGVGRVDPPDSIGGDGSSMAVGKVSADQRATDTVNIMARKTGKNGASQSSKKSNKVAIRIGRRVKATRGTLLSIIPLGSPAYDKLGEYQRKDTNFYGTVKSKKDNQGLYAVQFDAFPLNHQQFRIPRKSMAVLKDGEDEPKFDREQSRAEEEAEECAKTTKKKAASAYQRESTDSFLKLSTEEIKIAKNFKHQFGPKNSDCYDWQILQDDEDITTDTMSDDVKNLPPFKQDIPWNENTSDVDYNKILFEYFLPNMKGKAAVLDEWARHPNSGWKQTVVTNNIKFNRPDQDDPDELVSFVLYNVSLASHNHTRRLTPIFFAAQVVYYIDDSRFFGSRQGR